MTHWGGSVTSSGVPERGGALIKGFGASVTNFGGRPARFFGLSGGEFWGVPGSVLG